MKSILMFFFLVFTALGAGIYFYETQIASPNAADALMKSKKKSLKKAVIKSPSVIKKPSPSLAKIEATIAASVKPSRVIDLVLLKEVGGKVSTKQKNKQREIDQSIRKTIKKSVSLEIQKAVVTEISKKR